MCTILVFLSGSSDPFYNHWRVMTLSFTLPPTLSLHIFLPHISLTLSIALLHIFFFFLSFCLFALRLFRLSPHHYHTHMYTHTLIGGEANYFRTGKLFCLVHPCLSSPPSLSPPLSHQQMGYFNEISLACSHLCEK